MSVETNVCQLPHQSSYFVQAVQRYSGVFFRRKLSGRIYISQPFVVLFPEMCVFNCFFLFRRAPSGRRKAGPTSGWTVNDLPDLPDLHEMLEAERVADEADYAQAVRVADAAQTEFEIRECDICMENSWEVVGAKSCETCNFFACENCVVRDRPCPVCKRGIPPPGPPR